MGYSTDAVQLSSAIEYRRDDAEQPDTTHDERTAWLFRNSFKFQLTPDWRIVGKVNRSFSDSSLGDFYGGGYTEAVVGYAYRPLKHDRFNALVKFTYFYNFPTCAPGTLRECAAGQVGAENTPAEFIQKSAIAALDLNYDLTASWSIGGKYAYRVGSVSLDRDNPEFFDNTARLAILRVDWRFHKDWEGMGEARMLDLPDVGQRRVGALAAMYRYLGKHLKAGAGYNFTDFSDDLTDLSYKHQGTFVNVIGTW